MFITKAKIFKEDLKYKWRVLVPAIVKVGPVDVGYVVVVLVLSSVLDIPVIVEVGPVDVGYVVVVLVLSSVLDAVVEEWSRVVYPLGIPSSK